MSLRRSSRPSEAAPGGAASAAPAQELERGALGAPDAAAPKQTDNPIKPGAGDAWKAVDKEVKDPKVREDLGKMVDSEVFRKLDAKGQTQALDLFKSNLGDPAGPGRVREAVRSLGTLKSEQGAGEVLSGLAKASPLSAETVDKTRALLESKEFAKLPAADQRLVTGGLKESGCNPQYADGLKGLMQDPQFKALKPQEQQGVLKRTQEFPDARTTELFKANLGSKDGLGRVQDSLGSLGNVKSPEGRQQVLDGLKSASPLSADAAAQTKALLSSPKFAGLAEADQKLVTQTLKDAKADPKMLEASRKLIEDPKFGALPAETKTKVLQTLSQNPRAVDSAGHLHKLVEAGNFQGLSAAQQSQTLDVFQKTDIAGRGHLVNLTNRSVTSGSPPVTRPALLDVDSKGGKLLDSLHQIASGPLAPGFANNGVSRESLLSSVMQEAADPGEINQDNRGTCGPAVAQYMMCKHNPAEYLRLTAGLLGPEGKVQMANGETLTRLPESIAPDSATDRSGTERVFQAAVMNYAVGGGYKNEEYIGYGGNDNRKALSALFNQKFERRAEEEGVTPQGIVDLCSARQPADTDINLLWPDSKGTHFVSVDRVVDGRVYFRNPHGGSDNPGGAMLGKPHDDSPPRRVEASPPNPKGYQSMSVADFKKYINSASIPEGGDPWRK